ncbi:MAG: efflux RND transporter periplasmic adaptor subunit [Calditrichia bacterium]
MHLTKGEAVNDNSHDIIIADLSYVWADLAVFQKRFGACAGRSSGRRFPPANRCRRSTGKVSYISPTMSEAKRTATARVIVANPNGHWRPGLFVNAEVVTAAIEVPVAVPKSALNRWRRTVVFVKTPDGFRPQPVSIGRENHVAVEIRAGLQPGEIYVTKNGFHAESGTRKGRVRRRSRIKGVKKICKIV